MKNQVKAIIPAAGYATRLYPLTKNQPKQLLRVGSKRMIEHIVHKIEDIPEIDHIFIVTNAKFYENFKAWAKRFRKRAPITIINDFTRDDDEKLGAVGDIHYAVSKFNIDDDVLIIGGDNLFEFSITDMHDQFRRKGSMIAVRDLKDKNRIKGRFGCVEINKSRRITDFAEKPQKPKTTLTATMVYMLRKEHLKELHNIMSDGSPDNAGEFIRFLSERRKIYSYVFDEPWYDIGSFETLKEVNDIYR